MIDKLIVGISQAIAGEFKDGYTIYTEDVTQGLKGPCFIVRCINPTDKIFRGQRYERRNQFVVNYFPSTDAVNAEIYEVIERLNNCLEHIRVDGNLIRGVDTSNQTEDGVLHYFVNYNFFGYKVMETTPMEEHTYETNTGG